MKKKIVGCILASVMVISCLSGCGNQEKPQEESKESSPSKTEEKSSQPSSSEEESEEVVLGYPIEGDVTLTIAWPVEAAVQARAEDISETLWGKTWQETTGINIEIISYADETARNMLLSSGDLPDIIIGDLNTYPGGATGAIADGIVQPITDYMEYAPDLQAIFDEDEDVYKACLSGEGEVVGFLFMRCPDKSLRTTAGLMIRKDYLDEVGMDVPTNADEFYDALKAFKEELGVQYPLTGMGGYITGVGLGNGNFTSSFNLPQGDFYVEDGKVHYGYIEDEMKDALAFVNKLVEEELLNPNFMTLDDAAVGADMMSGVSACTLHAGSRSYVYTNYGGKEADPDFEFAAIAPFQTPDGQLSMSGHYQHRVPGGQNAYITTSCENIEAAVRFLNYGYTEEGSLFFQDGIEGVSFELTEEGTVRMIDPSETYPEMKDWTPAEQAGYCHRGWISGPYIQPLDKYPEYLDADKAIMYPIRAEWTANHCEEYVLPNLGAFMSTDDAQEIAKLMADINTYNGEKVAGFVLGTESLDDFETYQKAIKDMGIDRVIELYQAALDKYNQF